MTIFVRDDIATGHHIIEHELSKEISTKTKRTRRQSLLPSVTRYVNVEPSREETAAETIAERVRSAHSTRPVNHPSYGTARSSPMLARKDTRALMCISGPAA